MKILFDHPDPFLLAHGGFQIQIQQTKAALETIGVEVEYLRWWDSTQKADLIHFFSLAPNGYLQLARTKRIPVVMTTLFTETCNRSDFRLLCQGFLVRLILSAPIGSAIKHQLSWQTYLNATHNIVGLQAEERVLRNVYGVRSDAISVVPLGLSENFLRAGKGKRTESHLICTGTITYRKGSLEIAELAKAAQVPILFVGKPYSPDDPYWLQFEKLIDGKWVKYQTHVESDQDMIGLLQAARGFVLKSQHENWCLSAHEAAACGLPVLLPDQKWSRERFGDAAHYFSHSGQKADIEILRNFYESCPVLAAPEIKLHSWVDVGQQLKTIYEKLLSTSR